MAAIDYRKIDIDALDNENNLTKEDLVPEARPVDSSEINQRAQQVRSLLQRGDHAGALQEAINDPPYGGDESAKSMNLSTVIEVLTSVRGSDMTPIIEKLDHEQQVTLLKYLYKGMGDSKGQTQGGVLLSWFEKLVSITGQGTVIQYISDRRTL